MGDDRHAPCRRRPGAAPPRHLRTPRPSRPLRGLVQHDEVGVRAVRRRQRHALLRPTARCHRLAGCRIGLDRTRSNAPSASPCARLQRPSTRRPSTTRRGHAVGVQLVVGVLHDLSGCAVVACGSGISGRRTSRRALPVFAKAAPHSTFASVVLPGPVLALDRHRPVANAVSKSRMPPAFVDG